ncbi:carbohydrate ABC transporter substrate-binding protein [Oxalobacteraceae bacterium]|nr:carbohydrate ABC transporter substrate-binding protein [Oxalobacteraceae bacterium]
MRKRTGRTAALSVLGAGAGLLALTLCAPLAHADALQVLHWWTSASERKAANVLAARLATENIDWRDAAIPGGAGIGAVKVLKSRVLAGNSPEVMQLVGYSLAEWSDLGLLLQLDGVAASGNWSRLLHPTAYSLVQNHGHVMAVPLGIHRINNLYYNRRLFARFGLTPSATWAEFERAAEKLRLAGITALAQSSEPWQVATLFETLVLAEAGPAFYRELFVRKNLEAYADPRLLHALKRLKTLRRWMPTPLRERPWTDAARQLADGDAAMFIMGDWAKGELNAWGLVTDEAFGCVAVPETAQYHLFSIDTLAMFSASYSHQAAQEKLAEVVISAPLQADYNRIKGSIPVLRGADTGKMDSCARNSVQVFARGAAAQAPSLVHRMASDESTKDAIVAEVSRYFNDEQVSAADAQRRLATIVRATSEQGKPP